MKKLLSIIIFLSLSNLAFSQIKISALPMITGSNTDSVWVPIVQGLTTKKAPGYMFKGNIVKDTVLAKQPLYVDAGVKDTLKFNADSSGLVRDAMRSNDSVYLKINGEWVFAFIDSVGSGGGRVSLPKSKPSIALLSTLTV